MSDSRCSGQCCRLFIVPAVHDVGGLDGFKRQSAPGVDPRFDTTEHRYIANMLIDTGNDVEFDPLGGLKLEQPQRAYKCKHFDGSNCTAYEARPDMCRLYPSYHGSCNVKGCTYEAETQRKTEDEPDS